MLRTPPMAGSTSVTPAMRSTFTPPASIPSTGTATVRSSGSTRLSRRVTPTSARSSILKKATRRHCRSLPRKWQGIYQGTPYATDPNAKVEFTFNGDVVMTISVADFLNANEFQTFEVEVTGTAGADTFGIRSRSGNLVRWLRHRPRVPEGYRHSLPRTSTGTQHRATPVDGGPHVDLLRRRSDDRRVDKHERWRSMKSPSTATAVVHAQHQR